MSVRIWSVVYLRAMVLGKRALLTYRVGIGDEFLIDYVMPYFRQVLIRDIPKAAWVTNTEFKEPDDDLERICQPRRC